MYITIRSFREEGKMIRTFCPGCGQDYEIGDELLGKRVECDLCGAKWTAPEAVAMVMSHAPVPAPTEIPAWKKGFATAGAVVLSGLGFIATVSVAGIVLRGPLDDACYEVRQCEQMYRDALRRYEDGPVTASKENNLETARELLKKSRGRADAQDAMFNLKMFFTRIGTLLLFAIIATCAIVNVWTKKYTKTESRRNVLAILIFAIFGFVIIVVAVTAVFVIFLK